jgi:hypothetical protein
MLTFDRCRSKSRSGPFRGSVLSVGSSSSVEEVTDGLSIQHLILSSVLHSLRSRRVSVRSHTSVRIRLTIVSRRDLYRLSDSGPVVSSMGTTRVGTVPFMLILRVLAGVFASVSELRILEVRRGKVLDCQLAPAANDKI